MTCFLKGMGLPRENSTRLAEVVSEAVNKLDRVPVSYKSELDAAYMKLDQAMEDILGNIPYGLE